MADGLTAFWPNLRQNYFSSGMQYPFMFPIRKRMLERMMFYLLAGMADLILALLHVLTMVVGGDAYIYLRAGKVMAAADAAGEIWPALLTLAIAIVFLIWSLICFWAAVKARFGPAVRGMVAAVGAVFVLRGSALFFQFFGVTWFSDGDVPVFRDFAFSLLALVIGALHLYAAFRHQRLWR